MPYLFWSKSLPSWGMVITNCSIQQQHLIMMTHAIPYFRSTVRFSTASAQPIMVWSSENKMNSAPRSINQIVYYNLKSTWFPIVSRWSRMIPIKLFQFSSASHWSMDDFHCHASFAAASPPNLLCIFFLFRNQRHCKVGFSFQLVFLRSTRWRLNANKHVAVSPRKFKKKEPKETKGLANNIDERNPAPPGM